jgi:hypothetical protein
MRVTGTAPVAVKSVGFALLSSFLLLCAGLYDFDKTNPF